MKNNLRPSLELWNQAQTSFEDIMTFVNEGNSSLEDKAARVAEYPATFDFAPSLARKLCEALEVQNLLARYPQFSLATPRYYHGGKVFFMHEIDTTFSEPLQLYTKSGYYTDAETGIRYLLEGQSWERQNRINMEAYLDGVLVHKTDFLKYTDSLTGMGRYQSSSQLIASAFNRAETALFAKLGLIPF